MTQRRYRLPIVIGAFGMAITAGTTAQAAAPAASDDAPEGGVSAEVLEELEAEVLAAMEVPAFDSQGEPFSVADLEGKKIFSMPVSSQLEGCDRMARIVVDLAVEIGMPDSTYFQNDGGPAAWGQGMEQALSGGYDGVALVCGIDPNALVPQMEAAREAGIPVVDLHLADVSDPPNELIAAQTNGEFNRAMELGVYQALIDSGGEPIDVLVLTANENPPSVGMEETVYETFAELCSGCNVNSVNIPIPEFATRGQGEVASALVENPELDALFMVYDFMTPDVISAIRAAEAPTLTYAFGGDVNFVPMMLEEDSPQSTDMGPNFPWMAYSGADQLFRVMVGEDPVPADAAYAPYRLWRPDNAEEILGDDEGFGDEWIGGYWDLWLDAPGGPDTSD